MICDECKKEIKNKEGGCYSKHVNKYFCSLGCVTDFAHEFLICEPITWDDKK